MRMKRRQFLSSASAVALPSLGPAASPKSSHWESGIHLTSLLELYTSEGCSSCPPADDWFTTLKEHPGLWKDFVPLAYHVDYWDHLGWKDRFARPEFTQRQRRHASLWKSDTIYTPGFVLNGREWRRGPASDLAHKDQPNVGKLALQRSADSFSLAFAPPDETNARWRFHLAFLGMNLTSKVTRGENTGRTLVHDFVVMDHRSVSNDSPVAAWKTDPGSAQAVAAWVSRDADPTPLQAVGGWL